MSDRSLHLEASLDKELYYHGEPISVNVHVTNNSSKSVKKVKVSVRQYADICLFSTAQYKCPVAQVGQEDQVAPSSTFCKVYTLTPLLSANREKRGLALDGKLKHEDTNLASSTIYPVYHPRASHLSPQLWFPASGRGPTKRSSASWCPTASRSSWWSPGVVAPKTDTPVDANLIEFEPNMGTDDDIVFEDFARLRLKGMKDDEEEVF
ncbi:beta-arrestin-2 isoform X3 [Alligator sinensis]|uniref:Beta-arrestin-2 isoform X3 n=1 Tax=Alligator sinensis TaxID=38654 RepID=A0A3Q0H8Z2_ALLSI|nr:beta-arrestin-2 isoform X3 [Alligator sinensis]